MTNSKIPSPVVERFHAELKRLLEKEAITQPNVGLEASTRNKVPQRRLVKLPPASHPLFPELSMT